MLLKLPLDKSHGKSCGIDGHINCSKHIWQCSDMILMTVSYYKSFNFINILIKICYIRND